MESSLLATKWRIPPEGQRTLPRPALTDALERGVAQHKLILLAAPAGFGKTTLVAQWANASHISTVWLSLGEEDNDVERWLRYLLAAWAAVQSDVRESAVGVHLGALNPNLDAVLPAFINFADQLTTPLVFVLDDYHTIEEPAIHQALTFLLDHLPPTVTFILAGRSEPPLPLARYRAHQELLELHAQELQLREEETADFLARVMGVDLPHAQIARLHDQLEGWVAGVQLAALSLQRRTHATDDFVVSGRHRFIADYLSSDVLADLDGEVRQFLLQTGVLERFCAPLCDAVREQGGSQAMLEKLEREKLFLVPLDDNRHWFRYHRLFAEFLREVAARQHADQITSLHRRAARWYLAHDAAEPAFHHAIAGDAVELVVEIFDRYVNAKLLAGEFRLIRE